MPDPSVLVVDDEKLIGIWLQAHLKDYGYEVEVAETARAARSAFASGSPDAVVLDLKLPDGNGLDLLREFVETDPEVAVIILSAHGDIDTAVNAVKLGAYHFLEKPPTLESLATALAKGLESRTLKRAVSGLRKQAGWHFAGIEIVGRSKAMKHMVELVGKIAASDSSMVLIRGESGVGKEIAAQAIHARSERADFPFLEINCTALPENLLESELFGHERGAFTDARERKRGLLELADRGTILLDEIGDLPLGAQAKLLRFLETRKFKRVGGVKDIAVDVRIVASTNRNLEEAMAQNTFREDLFYRLNVIPLVIPPLRERPEDVRPLAEHFLEMFAEAMRRPASTLDEATIAVLERYLWPGNVRELKNVIERALILEEGTTVLPDHLPAELRQGSRGIRIGADFRLPAAGLNLQELEDDLLRQALERTGGNKTRAAELLGLSRDTLRYRLEKLESANKSE